MGWWSMMSKDNEQGFTLVEFIVAMCISVFLFMAIYYTTVGQYRSISTLSSYAIMQNNVSLASLYLEQDIRSVATDGTNGIDAASLGIANINLTTADPLTLQLATSNASGYNYVWYFYYNNQLYRGGSHTTASPAGGYLANSTAITQTYRLNGQPYGYITSWLIASYDNDCGVTTTNSSSVDLIHYKLFGSYAGSGVATYVTTYESSAYVRSRS
jgi:prepilin-type N-terminal cleavage/methylation domain-containing protein